MYGIAKYLGIEGRERAASCTYVSSYHYPPRVLIQEIESCPLGVAITGLGAPSSSRVAGIIKRSWEPQLRPDEVSLVIRLAHRFISDWDNGRIHDLRKAFGLPATPEQ